MLKVIVGAYKRMIVLTVCRYQELLINLIRLHVRRVDVPPEGSGGYKHRIPEGFPPASDEAISQVVFIIPRACARGEAISSTHLSVCLSVH